MEITRRQFLKISGLALAGVAAKPLFDWISKGKQASALSSSAKKGKRLAARRWAMVIDANACRAEKGCRECIKACNAAHSIPEFPNPKDAVKWIWTDPYEKAFPERHYKFVRSSLEREVVPLLCNHCDNPPCVQVCPTKATYQRDDGIVMIDYHRCIGCRYCMAACPYGARSLNWRDPRPFIKHVNPKYPPRMRGVVEKCNFCAERLARGQLPACVEACPEKALHFGDVGDPDSEVSKILQKQDSIRRKPSLGTRPQDYYLV